MTATHTGYSGTTALAGYWPMRNNQAALAGITGAKRSDGYSVWVGSIEPHIGAPLLPVTRIIRHNPNGRNHKCDRRCTHAKGSDCECQCGGRFHGIHR